MVGGKHILGKPKSHRIFGTARVGERGQIVIPKEARQFYGIRPGDTVLVLGSGAIGLSQMTALNISLFITAVWWLGTTPPLVTKLSM